MGYTPGKENGVADALSRKPIAPKYKEIPMKDITALLNVMTDNIDHIQKGEEGEIHDLSMFSLNTNSQELMSMCFAITNKDANSKANNVNKNSNGNTLKELNDTVKNVSILSKSKLPFEIPLTELAQM